METEEFCQLANKLQIYGSIFNKLWSMGRPSPSSEVNNVNISFDRQGRAIKWAYNPEQWALMTDVQKEFFICHACLHVIYMHGIRSIKMKNREYANIAMDLVTNEMLTNDFDFQRHEIDPNGQLFWLDIILPKVSKKLTFEQYYDILNNLQEEYEGDTADEHNFGDGADEQQGFGSGQPSDEDLQQLIDAFGEDGTGDAEGTAIAEVLRDALGEGELQEFLQKKFEQSKDMKTEAHQAGKAAGNLGINVAKVKVVKKRKWETIIKIWGKKYLTEMDEEQWARKSRRMASISCDFILPSDVEGNEFEKSRIGVWFFQDTSGSCAHLADRFFKAAESLPEDRFDVRMHCFDTKVYPTTLKSRKLYGFGGTTFTCIDEFIKESKEKPQAVFVITDGYGDKVSPEFPKKWYWFLSADYRACIPSDSKIFMLADFE